MNDDDGEFARQPIRFACLTCGDATESYVVETRSTKHRVRRRRACRVCRVRYTTFETTIDPKAVESQHQRAKAIAAQLRTMAAALERMVTDGD